MAITSNDEVIKRIEQTEDVIIQKMDIHENKEFTLFSKIQDLLTTNSAQIKTLEMMYTALKEDVLNHKDNYKDLFSQVNRHWKYIALNYFILFILFLGIVILFALLY